MTQPAAFLFDMDGVLYAYNRPYRLELLESALNVPAAVIAAEVFDSGLEDRSDLGQLNTADYIEAVAARLGVPVRLGQWIAARTWSMAPEQPVLALARRLGAQNPIAMMSNNGSYLAEAIDQVAPELRPIFGARILFSGVLKLGKQNSADYAPLLAHLGWRAETTLLIDDNADYIAAAAMAGLQTHLFKDLAELEQDLAARGIEV